LKVFRDPRDSFEQLDLLEMVATTCGRPFGELQDDRSRAHRSPQLAHWRRSTRPMESRTTCTPESCWAWLAT